MSTTYIIITVSLFVILTVVVLSIAYKDGYFNIFTTSRKLKQELDELNLKYDKLHHVFTVCSRSEYHQRTVDIPLWRNRYLKEKAEKESIAAQLKDAE